MLKNHIKTHQGIREFSCQQCNLSFTTNGSLTRHMATHSDNREFVCPHCHKMFKTSVSCRKHIKIHRNEIVAFNSSVDLKASIPSIGQRDLESEAEQFAENQYSHTTQSYNTARQHYSETSSYDDDLSGKEIKCGSPTSKHLNCRSVTLLNAPCFFFILRRDSSTEQRNGHE